MEIHWEFEGIWILAYHLPKVRMTQARDTPPPKRGHPTIKTISAPYLIFQ